MDFSLTEEQTMLADTVSRFIDTDYDFEARRKFAESERGFDPAMWQSFAELGLTAVPFDEEDGGLGGGPIELMLLMEQFGRGLVIEPYLAGIVLAGGVLRRAANAAQKSRWLEPLIGGELHAALAFAEPQARFDIFDVAATATEKNGKYVISGSKSLVLNGDRADIIIVPARTSGKQRGRDGITLFAVAADGKGVSRRAYPTVDATRAADVFLDSVVVGEDGVLGEIGKGFATLDVVVNEATLAVGAEAVGIMQTMHDKTVEYSKSRVQFGVPIGTFQALQHRMVDMLMACEQSRSLLYWAVMLSNTNDAEASRAVSALKYQVGTAGVHVAREAVQLHGGMGVTWELDIAHYFKRMSAIDLLFGNADYHLDRYAAVA